MKLRHHPSHEQSKLSISLSICTACASPRKKANLTTVSPPILLQSKRTLRVCCLLSSPPFHLVYIFVVVEVIAILHASTSSSSFQSWVSIAIAVVFSFQINSRIELPASPFLSFLSMSMCLFPSDFMIPFLSFLPAGPSPMQQHANKKSIGGGGGW